MGGDFEVFKNLDGRGCPLLEIDRFSIAEGYFTGQSLKI
jgi:hypothetical protein